MRWLAGLMAALACVTTMAVPRAAEAADARFGLARLLWSRRFVSGTVVRSFPNLVPATGVCMDHRTSTPRPHPVAAAQCGQTMWNNFRLTRDRRWLAGAVTQARWLINFKQVYAGAWFFPYRWEHVLPASPTKPTVVLRNPWYSAMAQGEVLSLFMRLYETTGDARYRTAADRTFAALLVPNVAGRPWATWTYGGYTWFEETTFADGTGDRILNGHIFTVLGIYDYWVITRDARAYRLLQAGLLTSLVYAGRLRRPAWQSYYDDYRRGDSRKYHQLHVLLVRYLAEMTGDQRFDRAALMLWLDQPLAVTRGRLYLAKGTTQGYRWSNGRLVPARAVTLSKSTLALLTLRTRVKGSRDMWMVAGSGALRGLYVRQVPFRAYVYGPADVFGFRILWRPVTRSATVTLRAFDAEGHLRGAARFTPGRGRSIPLSRYTVIQGLPFYQLGTGPYRGRWIAAADLVI
ncbi:D-glucuronyl C5-epimerase family protein [Actinoplanes sp. NPDC049265]|uniref:D-glucuronyl C5-epimerase family protein n=1 Tax=Actinoplanes sp. NPDC049265 TaxID=3363902 RepID=UPI00371BB6AD